MRPSEFISFLAPYVRRLRAEGSPIFPSVRLAQSALETGWKIPYSNNLGGIKVGSGQPNTWWDGSSVNKATWEVIHGRHIATTENFRAYKTIYHFFKDQDLLFQLPRYERVRRANSPNDQAYALFACGYATDPRYPSKLLNIMRTYNLYQYDDEEANELQLSENEWKMLENALAQMPIDKSWVEKAKKRELTISELTWLNSIVLVRK